MTPRLYQTAVLGTFAVMTAIAGPAAAQNSFTVESPAFVDGGNLPADLKCKRDGGDGISPPLEWSGVPDGTQGFAVVMQHYPRGTIEGRDTPSQYWLLWDISADTGMIDRGNPTSIGNEGSDKDGKETGYTPPCSPGTAKHEYKITVYALDKNLDALPDEDDISVDWTAMMDAIAGNVISQSSVTFKN
ncbi:YbhB/YbcL family Raf kinase inhibitor-like protein [Paracoccus sp. JM45]|nr:YbhB/YbcL family Raf kinase inhibitor-like protein [Paracoccus sp. JM45]